MIRSWFAERLLDYLAFAPLNRGKYRLAQLASHVLDGAVVKSSMVHSCIVASRTARSGLLRATAMMR